MPQAPGLASSAETEGTGGWHCPSPCRGPQQVPRGLLQPGALTLLTTAAVKDSSLAPRGPSAGSSPRGTTPIQLSSAPSSGSSSPTWGRGGFRGRCPGLAAPLKHPGHRDSPGEAQGAAGRGAPLPAASASLPAPPRPTAAPSLPAPACSPPPAPCTPRSPHTSRCLPLGAPRTPPPPELPPAPLTSTSRPPIASSRGSPRPPSRAPRSV